MASIDLRSNQETRTFSQEWPVAPWVAALRWMAINALVMIALVAILSAS